MPNFSSPRLSLRAYGLGATLSLLALLAAAPSTVSAAPLVASPPGSATTTETFDFSCDVGTGRIRVSYSNNVEAYDADGGTPGFQGVVQCPDTSFTALAGMTINATGTATSLLNGAHFAWMQVVTTMNAPGLFADADNNPQTDPLTTPWSDTPPGGYNVTDICGQGSFAQAFDNLPWYANNTVGQSTLFDQPKNGVTAALGATNMQFETWLVCVLQDGQDEEDAYEVLPLAGFTWGFSYNYGLDANGNNNGTLGDDIREYDGTTNFGPFVQGGQPSAAFKAGYAKHWDITYANNPDDCERCMAPEPGSIALFLVGMTLGTGAISRRRR